MHCHPLPHRPRRPYLAPQLPPPLHGAAVRRNVGVSPPTRAARGEDAALVSPASAARRMAGRPGMVGVAPPCQAPARRPALPSAQPT